MVRTYFKRPAVNTVLFGLGTVLLISLGLLWRMPLYSNADFLIWSDEAANQLTIKHLFTFREPYYFYLGMRYQGLTEGLLSLPFVPFFGFSALSQKLAGTVVYLLFAFLALKFIFRSTQSPFLRLMSVVFAVFPTAHLYHTSFMAYGGHLLNALLGFALFNHIYSGHQNKQTRSLRFPLIVSLYVVIGIYTYKHFLSFYPALALMLFAFRGGLSFSSRYQIRNLFLVGLSAILWPIVNQSLGERIQSSTYETLNSFMTFQSFSFSGWTQIKERVFFVFLHLWPTFFATNIHEQFEWVGFTLGLTTLASLVGLFFWKLHNNEDQWKLYRISVVHIFLVLLSVIVTPYAFLPIDVRYLMPIYSVAPFIGTAVFTLLSGNVLQKRIRLVSQCMLILFIFFGVLNTVQFNHFLGLQAGLRVQHPPSIYDELIQYLASEKLNCVFADYSDAYKISLLTNEQIKVSGAHLPRIKRYEECALQQQPRIMVLRNNHEEIQMFLDFKVKNALGFRTRKVLKQFTVLESFDRPSQRRQTKKTPRDPGEVYSQRRVLPTGDWESWVS